jgi:hypothetical protein
MRVFLAKEGDTGRPTPHTLEDGATGAALIVAAGLGPNFVQFEYEGDVYKRDGFRGVELANNRTVVATASKATNGSV